ncbi:MAG TPA: hypothetical protein VM823_10530 [Gaiellales bacterium]|jgi:hypothetical protein|nr:hypothetical protein [Gaiellales bacterium]
MDEEHWSLTRRLQSWPPATRSRAAPAAGALLRDAYLEAICWADETCLAAA